MLTLLHIENRTDNFLYQLMDKNKVTCLKNSVEYIFKSHCSEKNHVPLYWCKVFELNDIMHNRRDIDMIMWLDSDAFFTSYEKMNPHKLESLHPGFAMWVSGDAPPLHFDKFNAGSFLLKNDDRGRSIIRNWKGQYDASRWSFNDGAWTTDGAWAGRDYEQGSFAENIMDSEEWSHMICKLPYYVFNEVNCDEPNEYLSTLRAITRCNTRMHA